MVKFETLKSLPREDGAERIWSFGCSLLIPPNNNLEV